MTGAKSRRGQVRSHRRTELLERTWPRPLFARPRSRRGRDLL